MATVNQTGSFGNSRWLRLIPLLLLTCWLGARGLNADPIWYDEWWSIYHAGGAQYGPLSAAETWTRVAQEDPRNTPGYYFVLQAWGLFMGWTPYAGRALSLFIGVLTTAWIYRLGRDLVSSTMGLGAAVVLGTGAFFTYYLHELRGYTLYALLTTICVWAYWSIITRKATWQAQLVLFLSVVGLLYTHYFASLTVAAIALYHLLFAPKNRLWWRVLLLIGLGGLTFVPWLHVLSQVIGFFQDTGASTWFALDTRSAVQIVLFMFSNGSIALLTFFALCGLTAPRRSGVLIWFWALAALGIGLVVNHVLQVLLHVRYLMALWPVLALIVGMGTDRLA
ncbi:MAG: glycosyltransferase family 39 protein, partial [Candidatus Methanoperedens sp.]|nr:glycosyltransferase family 39 protein [Candidatus Methanoperedens sp.]